MALYYSDGQLVKKNQTFAGPECDTIVHLHVSVHVRRARLPLSRRVISFGRFMREETGGV